MSRHTHFMNYVMNKLASEGYTIIDKEVVVNDLIIQGKKVRIDILVEKDNQLIPVECGKIQRPCMERISKLKEVYGTFLHVPYGNFKKNIVINKGISDTSCRCFVLRNGQVTIPRSTRDALGGIREGDILDIDIEIAKRIEVDK